MIVPVIQGGRPATVLAPYGTITVQVGDTTYDVPVPCEGDITMTDRGLQIEDAFGTWALSFRVGEEPAWTHYPNAWVRRDQRINDLRADVLAYLDGRGYLDFAARSLAERIRREAW